MTEFSKNNERHQITKNHRQHKAGQGLPPHTLGEKKITPGCIILKLLKSKDTEKLLRVERDMSHMEEELRTTQTEAMQVGQHL